MPAHATPRADEFIALIEERLPERTVRHSISVAEMMAAIADEAGVDRAAAVTAGLLHDLYKAAKGHELLELAARYGIVVSPLQRENPMLLHGPVAAETARHMLKIEDDEVYDAIYWHTTGRPSYGHVGLALYFADFAEPLRTMPEAAEARAMLERVGFLNALKYVVARKLDHLRAKHSMDPSTEAFHAWLVSDPR